jgi:hypothetical protein
VKSTNAFATRGLVILVLVVALMGCSTQNPTMPALESKGLVVQSNTGPVTLIKFDRSLFSTEALSKSNGIADFTETFIQASVGGEIVVGDTNVGFSKVVFEANDLPSDLTISMTYPVDEYCDGIFAPHVAQFNSPVYVELSYKNTDLTGINEDDLKIYYYNGTTDLWEAVGGTVDKDRKVVTGYLEHFSRYAIVKTISM